MIRSSKLALAALLSLAAWTSASAEQPGISDTEIKFGNIMPYSGPASALSVRKSVRRLFRPGQREGRRQRAQAQHDLARRRFLAAENRRGDAAPGRKRRRRLHVRHHGNRA